MNKEGIRIVTVDMDPNTVGIIISTKKEGATRETRTVVEELKGWIKLCKG